MLDRLNDLKRKLTASSGGEYAERREALKKEIARIEAALASQQSESPVTEEK